MLVFEDSRSRKARMPNRVASDEIVPETGTSRRAVTVVHDLYTTAELRIRISIGGPTPRLDRGRRAGRRKSKRQVRRRGGRGNFNLILFVTLCLSHAVQADAAGNVVGLPKSESEETALRPRRRACGLRCPALVPRPRTLASASYRGNGKAWIYRWLYANHYCPSCINSSSDLFLR
jgi:hypothetical protein